MPNDIYMSINIRPDSGKKMNDGAIAASIKVARSKAWDETKILALHSRTAPGIERSPLSYSIVREHPLLRGLDPCANSKCRGDMPTLHVV